MRRAPLLAVLLATLLCAAGAAGAAPAWSGRYTVAAGDSLTAIAARYHVSLAALAEANGLDWRRPLPAGTVLHVPAPAASPPPAWHGRYRVSPGDSLSVIAARFQVSLGALALANGLAPSAALEIGAMLHVPVLPRAPERPAARSSAWRGRYRVSPGDTLGAIAARYGVSLELLAAANGLDPSRALEIGAVLHVPARPAALPAARSSVWRGRYRVSPGDTLSAIAAHYGVSLAALAAANGLDPSRALPAGAVLDVPARAAAAAAGGWSGSYLVEPGDTLGAIALRFHVSLAALAQVNGLDPAGVLESGARLRVPAAASVELSHVAEVNPYPDGAIGYDFGFPGCAGAAPSGDFGVVGLNEGRPFTSNPCFDAEWAAAGAPRSVYLNTAYGAAILHQISPDCASAGGAQPLAPAAQRAYAAGCSEAEAALRLLDGRRPSAVWLDVEPGNTWSPDAALNTAAISGMLERLLLALPDSAVGVYSNPYFWRGIAGGWASLDVPEWVSPDGQTPLGCPSGFSSGPVWLSQTIDGQIDRDTAC